MSASTALPDTRITDDMIALVVERFYAAIRRHPVLAPVFENAIAADEWPAHLATMRRFWSAVMQASGAYSGNPVAVHRVVPGMDRALFPHWLALFEATATELFAPDVSSRFIAKAQRIADSLRLAVFHRPGDPPDGLSPPARRAPQAAAPCN
jgi:hemoglobin